MCSWGTQRLVVGMHESRRDPAIRTDKGQLCYRGTPQAHSEIEDTAFVGHAFACLCESVFD
jgi:hypothetical protein